MYDDDDYHEVVEEKNTIGLVSFIFSLTCVMSPVGLILGLIGLGKRPRGFAIAGVIISLLVCIGMGFTYFATKDYIKAGAHLGMNGAVPIIQAYEYDPDAPPESLGDMGLSEAQQKDHDGNPIRLENFISDGPRRVCNIRFPGPDGKLDTDDDFILPLDMK